jgi:TPR repeat protein
MGSSLGIATMAFLVLIARSAVADERYSEGVDAASDGDYKTASRMWTELATENDGRAQFQLGLLYHAGLSVERSETMAVQLYTSAAEKGVPEAQEYLAAGYENGWFGLPKNQALADYWLSRLEGPSVRQLAQR